jgi:hypothetical protein
MSYRRAARILLCITRWSHAASRVPRTYLMHAPRMPGASSVSHPARAKHVRGMREAAPGHRLIYSAIRAALL